jgi:hypothetical protein
MITGGHPMLRDDALSVTGETVWDPARWLFAPPAGGPGNLSPAPTVSALFGIGDIPGGYARPPLREAFDTGALENLPLCDRLPAPAPSERLACADLYAEVTQDVPETVGLRCTDTDPDAAAYSVVGAPAHGSVSAVEPATGQLAYTPDPGFTGDDTFTYKAGDADGESNVATVSLHVGAEPGPRENTAGCSAANAITRGDGDDKVEGTDAADSIATGAGRDRIGGGGGDDCIAAGTGRDVVAGDAGADTIRGGGGADRISGGDGRDLALLGGGGADRIDAADGEAEPVNCGRGDDLAIVDGGDHPAANCEHVRSAA